jgi:hypothetical protein
MLKDTRVLSVKRGPCNPVSLSTVLLAIECPRDHTLLKKS